MKWTIYSLLAINLALFLWHARSEPYDPVITRPDEDVYELVLLREYNALQQTGQVENAGENSGTDSGGATPRDKQRCFTLGPFNNKSNANKARAQLSDAGLDAKRRVVKSKTQGLWVYIPPAASRSAAKKHIRQLKKLNVKDYFLVVTGEQINAVSLGVYSKPDLAKQRYIDIQELGFEPQIKEMNLPKRVYWLDWPDTQILENDTLNKIRKKYEGVGQRQRNCDLS